MTKYINYILKLVLPAFLLCSVANAVEIYNKDDNVLNFNGRIVVGAETGNKAEFANIKDTSYSRININGTTKINDTFSGFGAMEFNMYFNNPSITENQAMKVTSRLSYVGLKTEYNSISFGKQYSTFYDVGEYTDMFEVNGDSAVTYNFYTFDPYERVNSSAVYRFTYGKLSIGIMGSLGDVYVNKNYQYSGSIQYKMTDKFKVGFAYQYVNYDTMVNTAQENDSNQYIVGLYYENDSIRFSDTIIIKKENNVEDTYSGYGSEGYLAYKFNALGTNVFTGYNLFKYSDSENFTTVPVAYASIGFAYYFNSKIYTYGEYKYDVRTRSMLDDAGVEEKESSFGLYLRYNI